VLARGLHECGGAEKLTSDELEGLGDHLVAAGIVVLVVGHVYGCVWGVFGVGVGAMAGGRRS
jgi:hypothetical protein